MNSIWKLNLISRPKLLANKLIHQALPTTNKISKCSIDINSNCPLCHQDEKTLIICSKHIRCQKLFGGIWPLWPLSCRLFRTNLEIKIWHNKICHTHSRKSWYTDIDVCFWYKDDDCILHKVRVPQKWGKNLNKYES